MYVLRCVSCDFNATVDSLSGALDIVESHQDRYGDHHFVEFDKVSEDE